MVKKIGYLAALFFLFVVILFTITNKIINPFLEKNKSRFENWAQETLHMPVKIKRIQASWHFFQPEINFDQVDILNKNAHQSILQIEKMSVFISILKSLWHFDFIPNGMMITGLKIKVVEKNNDHIFIEGFPEQQFQLNTTHLLEEKDPQSSSTFAIVKWLFQQPFFIFRHVSLQYIKSDQSNLFFDIPELMIKNGQKHFISGKIILQQKNPTKISFTCNWFGSQFQPATLDGKIYLSANQFSLGQWLRNISWHGITLKEGLVRGKLWMTFQQGSLQKVQSVLQASDVNFYSILKKSNKVLRYLSGNFSWSRQENQQIIEGEDVLLNFTKPWFSTNFSILLAKDNTQLFFPKKINIGYLNLYDTQDYILKLIPIFSTDQEKVLKQLQMKGSLQDVNLSFNNSNLKIEETAFQAIFSHLSFLPYQSFPGIENISGNIKWNNDLQGELNLNSYHTKIEYSSIFANTLSVNKLIGHLFWQRDKQQWSINATSLQFLNPDIAMTISGNIDIPNNSNKIKTNLLAYFNVFKVAHINRYLPLKIFAKDLSDWLKKAFLSGQVSSGSAELRGNLSHFPFTQKDPNEKFFITGQLKGLKLDFAPDWPLLRDIDAKLTFTGNKMLVEAEHANISGIPLTNIHGEILEIGNHSVLNVHSQLIQTNLQDAMKFIHTTPLEKTIGKMFTGIKAFGVAQLDLGLVIPFDDTNKTQVKGDLNIKDAQLNIIPWDLEVNHLSGQLQFNEDSAKAEKMTAEMFNRPLVLSVTTYRKKNIPNIRVTFTNIIDLHDIEDWLKVSFSKMAQGSTEVKGAIDFATNEPIELTLTSQLQGVNLDLPNPYGKKPSIVKPFSMQMLVNNNQSLKVKFSYSDLISTALIIDKEKKNYRLKAAALYLGKKYQEKNIDWPQNTGLSIKGEFDQLDWEKIKNEIQPASVSTETKFKLPLSLQSVDITTQTLLIAGQHLNQFNLQALSADKHWDIKIKSKEIIGHIEAPKVLTRQSIVNADFQRLKLFSSSSTVQNRMNAKTLPSINLAAQNVSLNDLPLGEVHFKVVPSVNGLTIDHLHIFSSNMNLQAKGEWTGGERNNRTLLYGKVLSSHVSYLLNSFDFNVRNFIAHKGQINFDLNWPAPPFSPSLAALNGNAKLELGPGRILDVGTSDSAKMDIGRMLSIFSLQSIPRRLSLDFSDVFQKGYSFDSIRGDFHFDKGNAYTRNLEFNGPMAKVGINGRIGLSQKDYDFTLMVTPYVTSSLPVAAAFVGGPLVGLAAFAVNSVIGSQVSKLTAYYYAVTGPWDHPIWRVVSKSPL